MKNVVDFIIELKNKGVFIREFNGGLKLTGEVASVTEADKNTIRALKPELLNFLVSRKNINKGFKEIDVVPVAESYSLSSSQQRIWILSQFEEGSVTYNMPAAYVFDGNLSKDALEHAFLQLIRRHESLRTVFKQDHEGLVKQFILDDTSFELEYHDLRQIENREEKIKQLVQKTALDPFDLVKGPLLRAGLFRAEDEKWTFAFTMHHIISDGWSMGIFVRELLQIYTSYLKGIDIELQPLRIQYKDYAAWQQQELQYNDLSSHRAYWLRQFEGELPVLELPSDLTRPLVKTYNASISHVTIDQTLTVGFKKLVQELGGTTFIGILAVLKTLFYKYTNQQDFIIGTPVAGREHIDLENQIGVYLNTLALRTQFNEHDSFAVLFQKVKQGTLDGFEHQVFPFDELINELSLKRDLSRNALFDVMLVGDSAGQDNVELPHFDEFKISPYKEVQDEVTKFDLRFEFNEKGNELSGTLEFNTAIYTKQFVETLLQHFKLLLGNIISNPNKPLIQLSCLSKAEESRLLEEFNATQGEYRKDVTLLDLFFEQLAKTPENTAISDGINTLTYDELDKRSGALAAALAKLLRDEDEYVVIHQNRSVDMIISMIAIFKCGKAYAPIEPAIPKDRKQVILNSISCSVLITDTENLKLSEELRSADLFVVNVNHALQVALPDLFINKRNLPEDKAYIIFTSGSTGVPKGVIVQHRPVINLIEWVNGQFNVNEQDKLLCTASISFDLSVYDIFGILSAGGCIRIATNAELKDPQLLTDVLYDENITFWDSAPASLQQLVSFFRPPDSNAGLSLRLAFLSGDWIPLTLPGELKTAFPNVKFIALGGATEATVWSNYFPVEKIEAGWRSIPYGKPISNARYYILNAALQPVPIGVTGDLYIGGEVLALGYNDSELSAKKFISDPFVPAGRMYHTGDKARFFSDGTIEFLGRVDDQVKIRGYRIELGDIESALIAHPSVEAAVVVAKGDPKGERNLVAYIISHEKLNSTIVRTFLSERLPAYMVPAHFVQVDMFPATANGKLDKKALPDPQGLSIGTGIEYVAPQTETEKKLAGMWEEILGLNKIGIKDNFFELGGHSLKATRLLSRIYKEFDVKLDLKDLFIKTILHEQAMLIDENKKTVYNPIEAIKEQVCYPLSNAQRRLWVISQFKESNSAYNIPGAFVFNEALDPVALETAYLLLLQRHEIIRTVFKEDEQGDIRQFILPAECSIFKIAYHDLRTEKNQKSIIQQELEMPFDLEAGPLLRVAVFRSETNKWIFTYTMHHIISDGWSMNVLIKELLLFYRSALSGVDVRLAPLRIQYKDYVAWQQNETEALLEHKKYWLQQLGGTLPVLDMPVDFMRPLLKTYNGDLLYKTLPQESTAGIKALGSKYGATLFMSLLATVKILLHRYTSQDDIIIGSPIAGREHPDLENQIGLYLNTLALRTLFKEEDTFETLLKNVKQNTLNAFKHQSYPFDQLVDELQLPHDTSRSPLFDVMVVLQNTDRITSDEYSDDALKVIAYDHNLHTVSKFDLTFTFEEFEGALNYSIEFNTDLYTKESIKRLSRHFDNLLSAIVKDPLLPVSRLDILDDEEKTAQLVKYTDTTLDSFLPKDLATMFEEQVENTPNNTALLFADKKMSYNELNELANQLSVYLKEAGLAEGDLAGIALNRGEWLIISILAVLKTGAAYVPVDMEYPHDRIDYMLFDSKCKLRIDEQELSKFRSSKEYTKQNPVRKISPQNLAYVIYTSGSTGRPKGVKIAHSSLYNYLTWAAGYYFENEQQGNFGLFTSVSFDLTVTSIFLPLLRGKSLEIFDPAADVYDVLKKYFTSSLLDTIKLTPSHLQLVEMMDLESTGIQKVILGGEKVNPKHIEILRKLNPGIEIYNEYGPTEATVGCMIEKISDGIITIGRPVANTQIFILNDNLQLNPAGVSGEMYIGGKGLALGYINNEEYTRSRFIANPFRDGELMYKTGDVAKWLPNGSVDYLGRKDDQVKIRGHRIELGEIEQALLSHPQVTDSVVLAKEDKNGEKTLVAYFISNDNVNHSALRNHLSTLLPVYMVPFYYLNMEQFPLTANGKIDKASLPSPEEMAITMGVNYAAPQDEIEEQLIMIWSEVLDIKSSAIGIDHNFFELGGNSIRLIKLSKLIGKTFGQQMSIPLLFEYTTIRRIAMFLNNVSGKVVVDEAVSNEELMDDLNKFNLIDYED